MRMKRSSLIFRMDSGAAIYGRAFKESAAEIFLLNQANNSPNAMDNLS
ncbi:MAG: hypothetical protein M3388_00880 [Acidobacteriota bacterium]|nr:hypothetical protein [Acidobacteriota bacterium]